MFVPDFPAEALVRAEPALRNAAVVVVEGRPPLLTVVAANEHARQAGVECGMTNVQAAARLNRRANGEDAGVLRRRSPVQEVTAQAALADCARAFSPRVEECAGAPDTVLLDLKGLERLFGTPRKIACELARRASELGLEANVAVSANLDAAICAARGFVGITVIPRGKEAERLGPLPVEVLLQVTAAREHMPAAGTAKASQKKSTDKVEVTRTAGLVDTLDRWGVRTFRALAALPEVAVAERLGSEGAYLQKLCRGEGTRTLVPTDTPLNFEETIELEYPIDDLEPLAFVLNQLIEQLSARLSARALSTNELRLRFELERCQDCHVRGPQAEFAGNYENGGALYERTLRLPVPMLDAKIFLRLLQLELRANPPTAAVTRVALRAQPVQPRNTQGGLFLPTAPEPERLELTLSRIAAAVADTEDRQSVARGIETRSRGPSKAARAFDPGSRFVCSTHTVTKPALSEMISLDNATPGPAMHDDERSARVDSAAEASNTFRVGSPEILDTHRSDAFRMKRFVAPSVVTGPSGAKEACTGDQEGTLTALRLFRPPLAAEVDVIDGRPTWIHTTTSQSAIVTISGGVAWCCGPWRTSGEWWNESWSHQEWDVAVEDNGRHVVCRVYYDEQRGGWFIEGVYD